MPHALSRCPALVAGLFVLPVGVLPVVLVPAAAGAAPVVVAAEEQRRIPEGEACPTQPLDAGEPAGHVDDRGPLPELLDLDRAHELATGKGIGVAVVDVGVWNGTASGNLDVRSGAAAGGVTPGLQDTHGTMVAGLIAGRNQDGKRLGVAPGAHIVPIKVADGRADIVEQDDKLVGVNGSRLAEGIDRAIDLAGSERIKVINVSLNLDAEDPDVTRAIRRAAASGILVVASVGNRSVDDEGNVKPAWKQGEEAVRFPATVDGVLGVTALGPDDTLRSELVWTGKQVDVSAPSFAAVTVAPGGVTCRIDVPGSSWAAAEVSGLAALLFERFEGQRITPQQAATRIMATAQGAVDSSALDGHGMIQPLDALTAQLDISPKGRLTRAEGYTAPQEQVAAPPLPTDENAPARRVLLWWSLGAGGLLIGALLLRPLARRRG